MLFRSSEGAGNTQVLVPVPGPAPHRPPHTARGRPSPWSPDRRSHLKSLFVTGYLSSAKGFTNTSLRGPNSLLSCREPDPIRSFPPGSCTALPSSAKAAREEMRYETSGFDRSARDKPALRVGSHRGRRDAVTETSICAMLLFWGEAA